MSRFTDHIIEKYEKDLGKIPIVPMVDAVVSRISWIRSIRIPDDAATARTPESDRKEIDDLTIPPQFEVERLISSAAIAERRARAGGIPLNPHERSDLIRQATHDRVKALTLHLGIETL